VLLFYAIVICVIVDDRDASGYVIKDACDNRYPPLPRPLSSLPNHFSSSFRSVVLGTTAVVGLYALRGESQNE